MMIDHLPVSGVWSSPDGRYSLELHPDGRFIEVHAEPRSVFTGAYVLVGETLKLFEDRGAVVTGRLAAGRLSLGSV